jgi:acyl-coenzyme A synthetase/AMP-(fatty) acid ligase
MMMSVASGSISEAQAQAVRTRITPNLYSSVGSTETITFAFTRLQTPEDRRWHCLVEGRGLEIVGDDEQPLPAGRMGLVRVSTDDGPTQYLNDPAATASFFRAGYFYPGDLGVIREDGRLSLQGRVTDVINWLGHKIAPAPIEDSIREALGVADVCLFSLQNDDGEEEIHVVLETSAGPSVQALTAILSSELHAYARAHVHTLPSLPRNAGGKVLRTQVRAMVLGVS